MLEPRWAVSHRKGPMPVVFRAVPLPTYPRENKPEARTLLRVTREPRGACRAHFGQPHPCTFPKRHDPAVTITADEMRSNGMSRHHGQCANTRRRATSEYARITC